MQLKERAQFHRKLLMIMANGADGVGGERNQSDLRRQTINQPTNQLTNPAKQHTYEPSSPQS